MGVGRLIEKRYGARLSVWTVGRYLLDRQVPRRIYLIMDRHPVHRAGAVKKWLGMKGRRVRLFYLPGYRPDLNPDDYLNQDVRSNAVGRRRPLHAETTRKDIFGYLRSRQRRPQIVMDDLKRESVRYAS